MGFVAPIEETKKSIAEALHFATVCAAQKAKVNEPEILSQKDLHSALEAASPALFTSLQTLRNKYDQWLEFHENTSTEKPVSQTLAHTELEDARKVFLDALHAEKV